MIRPLALVASVALSLLAGCSPAAPGAAIAVSDAWARATAPGQTSGAAYLTLQSSGDDQLVGVSSPLASASLHETMTRHHMAGMMSVKALDLPAGQPVTLEPGRVHVMLMGLKAPLTVGSSVPLTLDFAHAPDVTVSVAVVDPASR